MKMKRERRDSPPRNRDIDCVLVFFLTLFVFLEAPNFLIVHEEELSPIVVNIPKNKDIDANVTGATNDLEDDDLKVDTRPSIAVNWEHVIARKESNCHLIQNGHEAPLPLIYVGLGRSGSFLTWATIAKMMGDTDPEKAIEITGRNQDESRSFFNNSIPDEIEDSWPSDYICDLQQNSTDVEKAFRETHGGWGIVGFQWKPFHASFYTPKALGGFQNIADAKIKVIYQTRNPIDKRLSNMRHNGQRDAVPAHCHSGDDECIQKHQQQDTMHEFLTGEELIHWLNTAMKDHKEVLKRMDEMEIDYIHVSYEELYMSGDNDAKEWRKIFRLLGWDEDRVEGITYEDIQSTFDVVKTSSKTHKDLISNYEEVKETLAGTKYADLLN